MSRPLKPETVARVFHDACLAELDALKPGNVHRYADGHRMTVEDFMASADAAAPAIGSAGLAVGERIRLAVEATKATAGQNTNLGIILLAAPLAGAALASGPGDLHRRLTKVLAELTIEDARAAYCAIRTANPGGLGEAPKHDIAAEPDVTLLEAMRAAERRDRIAWNYTHDFVDIFELGLIWLRQSEQRWGKGQWAVTAVYLGFLAHLPDTLIERKFGTREANKVTEEALPIEASLRQCDDPETMAAPLLAFDRSLKERGLNPGTCADLTVATLFAHALQDAKMPA